MVDRDKQKLFLNMTLGTIGTLLISLVAMKFSIDEGFGIGFALIVFGFSLTINYINFLEKKAEISPKLTWTRTVISIILFFSFSYFLYV
jgi:hypothetical protein